MSFTTSPPRSIINRMTSAGERIGRGDVAIFLAVAAVAAYSMAQQAGDADYDVATLAAPFAVLTVLPLLWRRAAPLVASAVFLPALLAHGFAFGDGAVRCGFALPAILLLAFAVGSRLDRDEARWGLGLLTLTVAAMTLHENESGATPDSMVFLIPLTAGLWWIGRAVQSRASMAQELEHQTVQLREARDERARLEVATDRARLSSELDELLQRRLGDLARLADEGAGETDPQRAALTLAEIERASRTTLEEMRSVVGVLRGADQDGDAPREPQPALTHLDALLLRAKGEGALLEVEGNPRTLPPGVELSAYRVVEHLLGALQDAPGVAVRVRFGDDALELDVTGPARPRSDAAIERARERARLHHGNLEARVRDGRAEAHVSLPLYAAV